MNYKCIKNSKIKMIMMIINLNYNKNMINNNLVVIKMKNMNQMIK